jgi:hypothetical protein
MHHTILQYVFNRPFSKARLRGRPFGVSNDFGEGCLHHDSKEGFFISKPLIEGANRTAGFGGDVGDRGCFKSTTLQ